MQGVRRVVRPEGDSVEKRKRRRRTKEALTTFDNRLVSLAAEYAPATVRQIFYLATTLGLEKIENSYKRVCERLKELRLKGIVEWWHIADRTRFQRKPLTFRDMRAAVEHTRRTYRRAVWFELPCRVFVVLEKDALAGVVGDITEEYDVPLLITRGFSSLSFVHRLAEDINVYADYGIRTYVYALGDWDPSGVKAHESFESRLIEWCPAGDDKRCGFVFSRLAVTRAQIARWHLPTRPTKKSTHAADWDGGDSVELDAVPPDTLRGLVREAIERHVPVGHMNALQLAEESERSHLLQLERVLASPQKKIE